MANHLHIPYPKKGTNLHIYNRMGSVKLPSSVGKLVKAKVRDSYYQIYNTFASLFHSSVSKLRRF